jgi:two-component system sensor histidine kinase BaeS
MQPLWVRLTLLNLAVILLALTVLALFILVRTRYALAGISLQTFGDLQVYLRSEGLEGFVILLEEVRSELLLTLLVAVVLALVFGVALARHLAGAFNSFTASLHRLSKGDYGARTRLLGASTPLEIALLGEEFNRMAARLEHLEAERRFESASIAHDLRTPITAMRLRVLGMVDGVHDLETTELEPLLTQLDTLERLADDLQTLTLHDAGHLMLTLEAVPVSTLFAALGAEFAPQVHQANVRLEVSPLDPQLTVPADPRRLRQALGNLVLNAVQHTPPAGSVRLEAQVVNDSVTLAVMDSGAGVPDAHLGRLFERFYRVDDSRSKSSGGSGLGLAIVRAIAVAHGGTVTATRSRLGGLEVRLALPTGKLEGHA